MKRSRIKSVDPETVTGPEKEMIERRMQDGFLPGIVQLLLPDLEIAAHVRAIYHRLHLRAESPFTRLQREMIATIVNGLIGGAP